MQNVSENVNYIILSEVNYHMTVLAGNYELHCSCQSIYHHHLILLELSWKLGIKNIHFLSTFDCITFELENMSSALRTKNL